MPAGQPNASINASLGIAPVDTGQINNVLGGAMERLQRAYEAGVVTYNDLMDAATTKPAARKALQAQLQTAAASSESQRKDIETKEQLRPITTEIQGAQARKAAAMAKVDAALAEAEAAQLSDDDIRSIAGRRRDNLILGAQNEYAKSMVTAQQLDQLVSDPWGRIPQIADVLIKDGVPVRPDATPEQVVEIAKKHASDKRELEFAMKGLPEIVKSRVQAAKDARDAEMSLKKEFEGHEFVRKALDVKVHASTVAQLLASPKPSASGDMAAVFSFMRMLDPGSVVREGEYERAKNASAVMDRYGLRNMWDRVSKGLLMTPDQRKDFMDTVRTVAKSRAAGVTQFAEKFRSDAAAWGLNPDRVTLDLTPDIPSAGAPPNPRLGPGEAMYYAPPTGKDKEGRYVVLKYDTAKKEWHEKKEPTPGLTVPDQTVPAGTALMQGGDMLIKSGALRQAGVQLPP